MQCMLMANPLLVNMLWGRINSPFDFSFTFCGAILSAAKSLKEKKKPLSAFQIFKLSSSTD